MTKHVPHELLAGTASSAVQVYAIRLPDGTCPASQWLDGLNDKQAAAILARVSMLAERGWLRSPDSFNKLAEADPEKGLLQVDEIKHVGENLRLYVVGFRGGSELAFVTHGTYKPKKKQVATEVTRARAIYKEGMKS